MRAWLYDLLWTDPELQDLLNLTAVQLQDRVMPRRSQQDVVNLETPFLIYGLGNDTNEGLVDDTSSYEVEAERQFFQVWVHDQGGDFGLIDDIVRVVKARLRGQQSVPDRVLVVQYLETSQEFNNETYGTNFRYIRFQAIKAKVGIPT